MLFPQARALRADFDHELLQKVRVRLQRLSAGLLGVTLVRESCDELLGNLAGGEFLFKVGRQEVNGRLAKVKSHSDVPWFTRPLPSATRLGRRSRTGCRSWLPCHRTSRPIGADTPLA